MNNQNVAIEQSAKKCLLMETKTLVAADKLCQIVAAGGIGGEKNVLLKLVQYTLWAVNFDLQFRQTTIVLHRWCY